MKKIRKRLAMLLLVFAIFIPTTAQAAEAVGEIWLEKTLKTGIDVSHHQKEIDWAAVKETGIDFAIIRCGYGDDLTSQDDKQWFNNIQGCEENDIPYGIYIYSYATSEDAARNEAAHTLRLLAEAGAKPEYPIYFDLEDRTVEACGVELIVKMANLYCNIIEAAGYKAGIYASKSWWENYLTDDSLEQYSKWVAHWTDECTYEEMYRIWQYTDQGNIDGIEGYVDMNYEVLRLNVTDVLAAPSVVAAELAKEDTIKLTWTNNTIPEITTQYQIDYKKDGGPWTALATGITGGTFEISKLFKGAKYSFRVTPYVEFEGAKYTGTAKESAEIHTLARVALTKIGKASKGKITIKWKDISGESGYEIARSTKKGKGYKVVKKAGANTKSVKIKATKGKKFFYKVRAYKTVNGKKIYGQWSTAKKYVLK